MPTTEAAILERVIEAEGGELTPEAARYLLSLDFRRTDRERMEELAAKARAGTPSPAEEADLETYRRVGRLLEHVRSRARQVLTAPPAPSPQGAVAIPPGIRRSQEAFRRDLPRLLEDRKLVHCWAAYHGGERLGIARDPVALLRECLRRGLSDEEYYVGWIDPTELLEEEDLAPPPPGELEDHEGSPAL